MILRIFLCTLGWSIRVAENWDTEKLKLSEKFKRRIQCAERIVNIISTHPIILEWKFSYIKKLN